MSVNYYLFSPSHNKEVMIGSDGFSGVQSFPAHPEVIAFVRWAIENFVKDIVFIDENRLFVMQEDNDDSADQ